MPLIPETQKALVLRTDFSDEAAWEALCAAIQAPVGEFRAYVDCVSDAAFAGLLPAQLLAQLSPTSNRTFIFLADQTAFKHAEHPLLVIDLREQVGRTFRVIPTEMWSVENNLSIANMDFAEFVDAADADGIFRGFRSHTPPYPACFGAMLAAWNETDLEKIRPHLEAALAEDVEFIDPTIVTRGLDEFEQNVRGFRTKYPAAHIRRTSGFDTHHNLYRYTWEIQLGRRVLVQGLDIVELNAANRVRRVLGFFGPLPELGAE